MGKIRQLSAHVADLIAAGEVVERPASAAKELVENAIDAGAKNITVEIQGGGMTFLRVTDDGCGMSAEDAETAFLRHATSKLREASDLEAISTLGFRGEALAAISAVSRIDLLTRQEHSDFGTSLHLEAGVVTERGEAGCPKGTTIIIRDLFYNTPARMKFMKRDAVEAGALLSAVQRLALAHPEIAMRVLRDGEEQLRTTGDGQLLSAIHAVMGRTTAKEMLPLKSAWEKYSLSGFVSTPTASRGNRSNEIFFVNGRHVRSKTMTAALEEAYRNRMMTGRFPSCVLHLQLPEHLVDVNVHPAKIEVKFLNERDVFDCVLYGVRGALEQGSGRVDLKLPKQPLPKTEANVAAPPVAGDRREASGKEAAFAGARPQTYSAPAKSPSAKAAPRGDFYRNMTGEEFLAFAKTLKEAPRPTGEQVIKNAQNLPLSGKKTESKAPAQTSAVETKEAEKQIPVSEELQQVLSLQEEQQTLPVQQQPSPPQQLSAEQQSYCIVGEALNTYIIVQQGDTLLFIDKHAAHERILFEKLRKNQEPIMPQLLLQPILCRLEREELAIIMENEGILSEFGFALSDFGDGVLSVSQIPADLPEKQTESTLGQLADQLRKGKLLEKAALRDELLHTLACKAAIKGGWQTDPLEREALVLQVLSREDLKYCPHGRPICAQLTRSQLERQFKRT
ncbi:MAG: DNA mismatch repair endonuclease MutL [Oscillospiraceae bacterium]|nr:DNA mismatch repair endonuclease MutL [Oscillospiraceae bacterium]